MENSILKKILFLSVSVLVISIVFTMINTVTEIEAKKGEGVKTKKFGSATANIVCGDRLCSEDETGRDISSFTTKEEQPPIESEENAIPFDNEAYDNSILALQRSIEEREERAKSMITPSEVPSGEKISPRPPATLSQLGWASLDVLPPHAKASALIIWNESLQREILKLNEELQGYIGDSEISPDEIESVQKIQKQLETMRQKTEQVISLAASLEDSKQWDEELESFKETKLGSKEHPVLEDTNRGKFLASRAQLQQEKTIMESMLTITQQLQKSILTLMQN